MGGELSVACARFEPAGWSKEATDRLQQEVAERACATGQAWFSTVRHAGETWLRFNLVNFRTREPHVRAVVQVVRESYALAAQGQPARGAG